MSCRQFEAVMKVTLASASYGAWHSRSAIKHQAIGRLLILSNPCSSREIVTSFFGAEAGDVTRPSEIKICCGVSSVKNGVALRILVNSSYSARNANSVCWRRMLYKWRALLATVANRARTSASRLVAAAGAHLWPACAYVAPSHRSWWRFADMTSFGKTRIKARTLLRGSRRK